MQKINRQTVTIMRQEIIEIKETKRSAAGPTVIEPPKSDGRTVAATKQQQRQQQNKKTEDVPFKCVRFYY